MANQDPQPEVYSTTHTFAGAAVAGTSNVISIFTNQANNEEVRLYAIGVEMLDATDGSALAAALDYSVSIQVGPNNVPSNAFSAGYIFSKNDRTLAFQPQFWFYSSNHFKSQLRPTKPLVLMVQTLRLL